MQRYLIVGWDERKRKMDFLKPPWLVVLATTALPWRWECHYVGLITTFDCILVITFNRVNPTRQTLIAVLILLPHSFLEVFFHFSTKLRGI